MGTPIDRDVPARRTGERASRRPGDRARPRPRCSRRRTPPGRSSGAPPRPNKLADAGAAPGARGARFRRSRRRPAFDVSGTSFTDRASSWIVGGELRWTFSTGGAELAQRRRPPPRGRARARRSRRCASRGARRGRQRAPPARDRRVRAQAVGRAAVDQARESQRIIRDRFDAGLAPRQRRAARVDRRARRRHAQRVCRSSTRWSPTRCCAARSGARHGCEADVKRVTRRIRRLRRRSIGAGLRLDAARRRPPTAPPVAVAVGRADVDRPRRRRSRPAASCARARRRSIASRVMAPITEVHVRAGRSRPPRRAARDARCARDRRRTARARRRRPCRPRRPPTRPRPTCARAESALALARATHDRIGRSAREAIGDGAGTRSGGRRPGGGRGAASRARRRGSPRPTAARDAAQAAAEAPPITAYLRRAHRAVRRRRHRAARRSGSMATPGAPLLDARGPVGVPPRGARRRGARRAGRRRADRRGPPRQRDRRPTRGSPARVVEIARARSGVAQLPRQDRSAAGSARCAPDCSAARASRAVAARADGARVGAHPPRPADVRLRRRRGRRRARLRAGLDRRRRRRSRRGARRRSRGRSRS